MTASQPLTPPPIVIDGPLPKRPLPIFQLNASFDLDAAVYNGILDRVEDGVYFVDLDRRVLLWNRGAEAITGFPRGEVLGLECSNSLLCHVDSSGRLLCATGCTLQRVLSTGVPIEADAFLQHKQGHRVPVRVKTGPLRDRQNKLVGVVQVFRSTSVDRRQDQIIEELSHLAMIDDLTRLPNRRHFDLQLDRRLAELGRFGWPFGLLMIDIDHFKQINDGHGHQAGDEILRLVARTLAANCRTVDTIARWGGEEFSAIIANVEEAGLRKVAEKFRVMIEASSLHGAENAILHATVSIGGAVAVPNETAAELLRRTDEMLYAAKNAGRNRVCI
jgi:diguanylate cyclase (GGDEF)-like protein/PAS domain S-box-containing protein